MSTKLMAKNAKIKKKIARTNFIHYCVKDNICLLAKKVKNKTV